MRFVISQGSAQNLSFSPDDRGFFANWQRFSRCVGCTAKLRRAIGPLQMSRFDDIFCAGGVNAGLLPVGLNTPMQCDRLKARTIGGKPD
jgi:hypothetical protein